MMEAPLRTVMTSAVDIAAAWALKSLAESIARWQDNRSATSIGELPFAIVSLAGRGQTLPLLMLKRDPIGNRWCMTS